MRSIFLTFIFLILGATTAFAQHGPKEPAKKKVVFIILDGISADQLADAYTPYLDSIAATGSYTDAFIGGYKDTYTETPTVSAVGYNSLLTGTWANKHNVWGNAIKAPNYHYPTIFRLYKDQYPQGKIGIFSSWLDNRTKLVGDGLVNTGGLKVDYYYDGLEYDTINYPHDTERNFMKLIDYSVADQAAKTIVEKAPDVSWVYLQYTDDMGHAFGDSQRFSAAITFEDFLVGKVWRAVMQRQAAHEEDWLLVVTTDHGRKEEDGKHHGGQTDREKSIWIVMNTPKVNSYFKEHTPGIVDILPTMTDFLNIEVPTSIRREFDGVSLVEPVDIANLKAEKQKRNVVIRWEALVPGEGKLYLSQTNHFKTGTPDQYQLLETVNLENGQVKVPLRKISKGYGKFVLETPNTSLNTWIVEE